MSVATAVLEATGLQVAVPDGREQRTILDHVDLAVPAGHMVAVVGASGSGKSTLLAVCGLLRRPDEGEVVVGGDPTSSLSNRARAKVRRERISFVFQGSNLFPSLRATEQVEVVAHLRGKLDRAARARARELLDLVELGSGRDRLPGKLSGGERQRVGIARALMGRPSVLLVDEPTASLDPERGRQVMEILRTATDRDGLATVVVTHDAVGRDVADRELLLRDGELRR